MAELVKDSLQVEFKGPDAENELKFEEDDRPHLFANRYIRLYPKGVSLVFSTSGTLIKMGNAPHSVTEVLLFNGDSTVGLSYPRAANVSRLSVLNKFFDEDGNQVEPTLRFDASRNLITSSIAGFGAVEVTYTSDYTLYEFRFSGGPCPFPPPEVSPYDQASIVAISNSKNATAITHLDPPDCRSMTFTISKGQEATLPKLRLETDPYAPPRFGIGGRIPSAEAGVLLFPDVSVDMKVNDGSLQNLNQSYARTVRELIHFTGNGTANMRYHPANTPAVAAEGDFVDSWGVKFSPRFHTPGDSVTEVEWVDSNRYRNPVSRVVNDDEIVVTDASDRIRPGYGIVRLVYAATYRRYRYLFKYNSETGHFTTGYVTARAEEKPANLQIDPPTVDDL